MEIGKAERDVSLKVWSLHVEQGMLKHLKHINENGNETNVIFVFSLSATK